MTTRAAAPKFNVELNRALLRLPGGSAAIPLQIARPLILDDRRYCKNFGITRWASCTAWHRLPTLNTHQDAKYPFPVFENGPDSIVLKHALV